MLQNLKEKHTKLHNELVELEKQEGKEAECETRFKELSSLTQKIERMTALEKLKPVKPPLHDMKKEDRDKWSFGKAVSALLGGRFDGIVREVHDELSKTYPLETRGVLIPQNELLPETRAPITGEASLEQTTIRPELLKYSLRERSLIDQLPVTRIQADGLISWPQMGTSTSGFVKGDGTDEIAESNPVPATSQTAEPHFLTTLSSYSAAAVKAMKSNLSLVNLLKTNMQDSMSEELSDAFLNADSATASQPDGFVKAIGTQGDSAKDLTAQKKWVFQDFVDKIKALKIAYKMNNLNPIWVFGPDIEAELAVIQRFSSSDGESILQSIGERRVTNHLANTRAFVGDWRNFYFITWGSVSLEMGRVSDDFSKLVDRVRAVLPLDFSIGGYKEAFAGFTITR